MNQPAQHVACDGCGIAKDDLRDVEMLQRRDEIWQELFRNAARLRKAMHSNAWLRPIFRKYKEVCREILDQKNKEATVFTQLCDHCDAAGNGNACNDLKLIREELEQIHSKIKSLEDMRSSSSSSSELSDDSDATFHNDEHEKEDNHGDDEEDEDNEEDAFSVFSSSSSSSSLYSSSSSSSSDMDMEDFV